MSIQCYINNKYCKDSKLVKGLCKRHYDSSLVHGDPLQVDARKEDLGGPTCFVNNCSNPKVAKKMCVNHYSTTYRTKRSVIYITWSNIKARCYKSSSISYKNYGGRGIKMSDEWLCSFEKFYEDMGDRPQGTSIDRIDNNGDYTKENCKWSTITQQSRNKRIRSSNKYGMHGISLVKTDNKYRVTIGVNGKNTIIGKFDDLVIAKQARTEAEKKYWQSKTP